VHVEAKGPDLVFLVIIAVATFLLPAVQRWLRRGPARSGTPTGAGEESDEDDIPEVEWRSEVRVARESPFRRRPGGERVEEEAVAPVAAAETPVAGKPSAPPVLPRPRLSLEERLFHNRRWSTGAKLMLAKEILDRPRVLRKSP